MHSLIRGTKQKAQTKARRQGDFFILRRRNEDATHDIASWCGHGSLELGREKPLLGVAENGHYTVTGLLLKFLGGLQCNKLSSV